MAFAKIEISAGGDTIRIDKEDVIQFVPGSHVFYKEVFNNGQNPGVRYCSISGNGYVHNVYVDFLDEANVSVPPDELDIGGENNWLLGNFPVTPGAPQRKL